MSEDKVYKDGDIVWVKLGNNWWPGEVTGPTRHPESLIKHLKRVPYCVVKFFNENTYEYVRSSKQIFPFQCAKQDEFIRKGYSLYNSGNSFMEKFPSDVEVAKQITRRKEESSLIINDRPDSIVKAILGQPLIRACDEYYDRTEYHEKRRSGDSVTKILNISQNRNNDDLNNEKPRTQLPITPGSLLNDKNKNVPNATANNSSNYLCNLCDFTSVRLNVMILHRKLHSNRNSVGTANATNAKLTPAATTNATITTTNINIDINQTQQKQVIKTDKNHNTKASTITTTGTRMTAAKKPSPLKETCTVAAAAPLTNSKPAAALTPKEKNNRIKKLQTPSKDKSKHIETTPAKKSKEENAYATILSDFCPSETETDNCPSSEEKQSRRSLRHCKNVNENTTDKVSTICIDLSETKIIKKIPKKREYSLLQLQNESLTHETTKNEVVTSEPDVVCLADNEKETDINAASKDNAEDIRRMLLADWSDDDEVPNDSINVDDAVVVENIVGRYDCVFAIATSEQNDAGIAAAVTSTSAPIATSSAIATGRIRNIPKKDRRDVVLQDFNSDLTLMQNDQVEDCASKTVAVDLDSSNSSVVEIIEDKQQPAAIITINDDEEQEKNPSELITIIESKDNDDLTAGGLITDKSASAATSTSTTTLSCFDFQEDEDEQESSATTISHFKKKYLSSDKLQNLSTSTTIATTLTELKEDNNAAKSRAEMAEKDQRLSDEIETLLEQTQPNPVADLLNVNSLEESISVKDLPIKERGKRIFKSRNKSRMEDKTNVETVAVVATVELSLPAEITETEVTTEQYKSNVNSDEGVDMLSNDKERNKLETETVTDREEDTELNVLADDEDSINKKCLLEISSHEILFSPSRAEIPKLLDNQLKTNGKNTNDILLERNNEDYSEVLTNDHHNTFKNSQEEMEKTKSITSESQPKENINNEKSIEITENISENIKNVSAEQQENYDINNVTFEPLLNEREVIIEQPLVVAESNQKKDKEDSFVVGEQIQEESPVVKEQTQKAAEKEPEEEKCVEKDNENLQEIEVISEAKDKNQTDKFSSLLSEVENVEKDAPLNSDKVCEIQQNTAIELTNPKSPKEITSNNQSGNKAFKSIMPYKNVPKPCSETIFKIRVKSPDQLFAHAFAATQQEAEQTVDSNADGRLIVTTPTDENSSMGASDTGAEFGSPTSMLSEERLPAFRFDSNQTSPPQQEIETSEIEQPQLNNTETVMAPEKTIPDFGSISSFNEKVREVPLKDKSLKYKDDDKKLLLQQRRFSMDLHVFHTEQKSNKRPRLSVDGTSTAQENNSEKMQNLSKMNRRKSRHMKVTPRRDVRELFKDQSIWKSSTQGDIEKSSSSESVMVKTMDDKFEKDGKSIAANKETQAMEDIVDKIEHQKSKDDNNMAANNENYETHKNDEHEKITAITQHVEVNHKTTTLNNIVESDMPEKRDSENLIDKEEELSKISEEQENLLNDELITTNADHPLEKNVAEAEDKSEPNIKAIEDPKTEETATKVSATGTEEKGKEKTLSGTNTLEKQMDDNVFLEINGLSKQTIETVFTLENKSSSVQLTDENINSNLSHIENIEVTSFEIPIIRVDRIEGEGEVIKNNQTTQSGMLSLDSGETQKDQGLDTPYSPGAPPPTPQEREVIIESENINQVLSNQQEAVTVIEGETDMTTILSTPKEKVNSNERTNQEMTSQGKEQEEPSKETVDGAETPKETEIFVEENVSKEKETLDNSNIRPISPENLEHISKYETLAEPAGPQLALDLIIEFENTVDMPPCTTPKVKENVLQITSPPQAKDLTSECEPATPQSIIECEQNIPAQLTPEKEIIIESHMAIASTNPIQEKDGIIIEENLQYEEKETLLARELQVIHPKENSATVDMTPHETQPNLLQTDADKAAEEFLIEFDNIVNHSHSVEEDVPTNVVDNAEDPINNIIEEVHEDHLLKQDAPKKSVSPIQYDPTPTYTVVSPKNAFNRQQASPAKRRQTICFEIFDTKEVEEVAYKKPSLDLESILPVNKTVKRTSNEAKLSNSSHQTHNIFGLNHNQLTTLKKNLMPTTTKRKSSIEDNITSFIIERPKQQSQSQQQPPNSTISGPPPLQRMRALSRQDSLFQELFPAESSSPTLAIDIAEKPEGGRVIHQQIISSPTISSIGQNKTAADVTKISKNKQIGVDSRGNKYVIIKTPPTDIVVQPALIPSTASTLTASNNFGTTITIQPRSSSSELINITKPTTKNINISQAPTTSSLSHKPQQQQMQQISITVPAKASSLEVSSNATEVAAKTHNHRNRRRLAAQAKAVAAAATAANSNTNSAKHRLAIEALSRRLSIASEAAPPLAKISKTSSTQISNNSNLTFFGNTQITNIAQQQLIQLQQQQQTQTTASPQPPPPIILNKNAHQRKPRKITHHVQQQQQSNLQHQQQIATAKSSQLIQQLQQLQQQQQQIQVQQQHQQMQQQFIAQITSQQQQQQQQIQSQQHSSLQPPPLQQIQPQTIPMQQQIVQQSDGILLTTAPEDDNVIDSMQLIALPTQPYPGYSETFLLCKVKGNTCKPVDNVPLYLNHQLNELVPVPLEAIEGGHKTQEHQIEIKASNSTQQLLADQGNEAPENEGSLQMSNINYNLVEGEITAAGIETDHQMHHHHSQQPQTIMEELVVDENGASGSSSNQVTDFVGNQEVNTELVPNNGILLNIEGQQVLLDAATFAHLLANPDANTQLISDDGTEYVLTHEVLAALQMQQEQQQALELANAAAAAAEQQQQPQQLEQAGGNDIIAVALAGSDLYDNDVLTIDTSQGMQLIDRDGSIVFPAQSSALTQQHITPPAVVTNAVLDQSPIMSTLEVPSSIATQHKLQGTQLITVPSHHLAASSNAALGIGGRLNLEDSLAAIGVTTQSSSMSSSLGLPITVTNPNIASKVTAAGPLNEMLQFVSHRPATAAATAAAVAAAALAGETRIFSD